MKISSKGIRLVSEFEGLRLDAYKCSAGIWTIGYGHTKGVKPGMRITEKQAVQLLAEDLDFAESVVNNGVKRDLTQNQFDALVSLVYNIGSGNFLNSTLLRELNDGDAQSAADEFPKWRRAGGQILQGLVRRRQRERQVFCWGYGFDNTIN